jgi:hypothetical protein
LFETILYRKIIRCLPIQTLLYVSFKHILIGLTNFMGIPNSMRILYNTSLYQKQMPSGCTLIALISRGTVHNTETQNYNGLLKFTH